jgi:hypothetical protein
MNKFENVKTELTNNGIDFIEGITKGWSENSLILDGNDCRVLVYVDENESGNLLLIYHDLFEEGEYNKIFDCDNEETTTSFRGSCETIDELIEELELV